MQVARFEVGNQLETVAQRVRPIGGRFFLRPLASDE